MSLFTPSLQSKGRFRLQTPLDTLLIADLEYTCTGLETIQAAASNGVDVFATYYVPIGLDATAFANDVSNNAFLVKLQAGVAPEIVVPSTYFVEKADIDGVPYVGMMVALNIGVLPTSFDLTPLKQQLVETVQAVIGVVATTRTIVTTALTNVSQDQHITIEANRAANITQTTTDYALMLSERARADSLQQKVDALTAYIITNHPVPPP